MKIRSGQLWRALLCAIGVATSAHAQGDTVAHGLFTYRDAVLAGGVISLTLLAQPLDERIAARLQDSSMQDSRKLHRLFVLVRETTAPGSYIIGTSMYVAGRAFGNEHLAEVGLHGTEALLVGHLTGTILKGVIGRQRPYVEPRNSHGYQFLRGFHSGDEYHSFPSGHTVAAFAAAAAVTSETSAFWPKSTWVIAPALFGGAALTGISRMYENRHWATDVIVGAGIGTFAGLKVVRFHHTNPGNRVDHWLLGASISPAQGSGYNVRLSMLPDPVRR